MYTYTIEDIREDIAELIKKNDITKFEDYILSNDISLKDLNNQDFDILIFAIDNKVSYEIIKFIVNHGQYETFDYYVIDNGIVKLPLFCAILNNDFDVAKLLLDRKADINFTINKNNIIYYLYKLSCLNNRNLKFILNNGFNIKNLTGNIIDEFIETFQNDFLMIISNFIYRPLILNLLKMYKNGSPMSDEQLQELINNEKKIIGVNEETYKNTLNLNNFKAIKIIFGHDISDEDIIFRRISRYELLEKAILMDDYNFVKNILSYESFNITNINSKKIFLDASQNDNKNIMKLLIKKSYSIYSKRDKNYVIRRNSQDTLVSDFQEDDEDKFSSYDPKYLNLILNTAIEANNLPMVKYLLEDDEFKNAIDINMTDSCGKQPLISAFFSNNVEMFNYLIEKGADCNVKNINGIPLLSLAIDNNFTFIKHILRQNVDINEKDASGNYPLFKAINKNNLDIVTLLIEYAISNDIDMNIIDINGNTPVTLAYKLNFQSIFEFLIKYLDINAKDSKGNNILYYAIFKNDVEVINELIDIGVNINFQDNFENSAIHISIYKRSKDILKILLANNNILLNVPNVRGETPIFTIIRISNYNMAEKIAIIDSLIKGGADVNYTDKEGNTPLIYGIQTGCLPIVELLIENGANVNYIIKKRQKSVLAYAVELGELDIVKHLVKCGADLNFKNEKGVSILRESIDNLKWEIFKFLVLNNVDNCMSGEIYEKGIVEKIIASNKLDVLKFLVTNNFNINLIDEDGNTPLIYAVKSKSVDIVKYLIENGANVHHKNNNGETIDDINTTYNSYYNKGYKYYTDAGIKIKDYKANYHRLRINNLNNSNNN